MVLGGLWEHIGGEGQSLASQAFERQTSSGCVASRLVGGVHHRGHRLRDRRRPSSANHGRAVRAAGFLRERGGIHTSESAPAA